MGAQVSHVIVNQLMQGCVVPEQLAAARALLSGALSGTNEALLQQMNTSITICNARARCQHSVSECCRWVRGLSEGRGDCD